MNKHQVISFYFRGFCVRAIRRNGLPWFAGSDVAKALGFKRPDNAMRCHCKQGELILKEFLFDHSEDGTVILTNCGLRFIPESDLYRLCRKSKAGYVPDFQNWIDRKVIPVMANTDRSNTVDASSSSERLASTLNTNHPTSGAVPQTANDAARRLLVEIRFALEILTQRANALEALLQGRSVSVTEPVAPSLNYLLQPQPLALAAPPREPTTTPQGETNEQVQLESETAAA